MTNVLKYVAINPVFINLVQSYVTVLAISHS